MDGFDVPDDPSVFDDIGPWSERKHGIVQDYARVYSTILENAAKGSAPFTRSYIDGYAGAGYGRRKKSGDFVKGSALRMLDIEPAFDHHYFCELDDKKYEVLHGYVRSRTDVTLLKGDTNAVLPNELFPKFTYRSFNRAFCLLDPYIHKDLDWRTIEAAGRTRSIDLLLHFPTMTLNRAAFHRDGAVSSESDAVTRFWGDESWRDAVYVKRVGLLATLPPEKASDVEIAEAFCKRLVEHGGFLGTSKPIPMKNSKNAVVYHLIFALPHATAIKAANSVAKYFVEYPTAVRRTKDDAKARWREVI